MSAIMTSRQAAELDHAMERNGCTAEDAKWLSTGRNLAIVLAVRRGEYILAPKSIEPAPAKKILGLVKSDIVIPGNVEDFRVEKFFREGTIGEAKVKIYSVWSDFHNWFGKQAVKQRGTYTLSSYKLLKNSVDGPIIQELGSVFETDVAAVFHLMEQQPNGQKGVLLTNGNANIFYCRDAAGVLRAVHVYWVGGGWDVGASSVGDPVGWDTGDQVFSRNS